MLHYLYSDVAPHSLHNFAMLHLKVFRALRTGARWGNGRGGGHGARRGWRRVSGTGRCDWRGSLILFLNPIVTLLGRDRMVLVTTIERPKMCLDARSRRSSER